MTESRARIKKTVMTESTTGKEKILSRVSILKLWTKHTHENKETPRYIGTLDSLNNLTHLKTDII